MSKLKNIYVCRYCDNYLRESGQCLLFAMKKHTSDTCDDWEIGDDYNFENEIPE